MMNEGAGGYDAECTAAREATDAVACMLIVIEGNRGNGFSMQTKDPLLLGVVPGMLRVIAEDIERQQRADLAETVPKLPDTHVEALCRPGEHERTCRYLLVSAGGWGCAKHTALQAELDRRVAAGTMNAQGDNCPGWPAPGG